MTSIRHGVVRLIRRVGEALGRNWFDTASWSVAIAGLVVVAVVTNSVGLTVVVAVAVAVARWALSVWRTERSHRIHARAAQQLADLERRALQRLRECAGALMRDAAIFDGKADPPAEWGQPRPPMSLEDLARAIREHHGIWYATHETATVSAWATAVRSASTTFASCAQALVPDLSHADRDVLGRAQSAANETVRVLDHLAGRWRAMDSLRSFSRENRPGPDVMQRMREPLEDQISADYVELGALLQRLHDLLLEIAKRAN